MPNFYSPIGNYEVWEMKPEGYYTKEEWQALHAPELPQEAMLDELKVQKAAEVLAWSNRQKAKLNEGYSELEVTTFEQQRDGATSILNGDTSTTNAQFVIALLTARLAFTPATEEINAFATLIMSNFNAAQLATIQIMGTQQYYEIALRKCTAQVEYEAVVAEIDMLIGT